ncbi:hypothetical protein D3C76_1666120 [compost metagenome]
MGTTPFERGPDVVDEQPKINKVLLQGLAKRWLLNQTSTYQRKAAAWQALGIETEKLVVQLSDHG